MPINTFDDDRVRRIVKAVLGFEKSGAPAGGMDTSPQQYLSLPGLKIGKLQGDLIRGGTAIVKVWALTDPTPEELEADPDAIAIEKELTGEFTCRAWCLPEGFRFLAGKEVFIVYIGGGGWYVIQYDGCPVPVE